MAKAKNTDTTTAAVKSDVSAAKTVAAKTVASKPATAEKTADKADGKAVSEVSSVTKKTPAKTTAKSSAKSSTAKTTAAKKTTAKKTEVKTTVAVQYAGKELFTDNLLDEVKKVWVEQFEGKLSEIKTIELYIKPEESKAYFVVNGLSNGNYFIYL